MVETEYNFSGRQLQIHQDDRLPICRLPAEIIVHIIKHIQGRAIHDENTPASKQRLPLGKAWRSFTLTCSYIRDVANSSPELWRKLESARNKKEWIQLCAERAESLPLSIYCLDWSSQNDDHLFILRFLPRACAALLSSSGWGGQDLLAIIQALNSEPLPHIRFLELKGLNPMFTIQPTFLAGATGQLEGLVLQVRSGIAIHKPPKSGIPALRSLKIECLKLECDEDISSVVQWLSGAPRIEELFITTHDNDSVPTATDRFGLHIPKISLPSLRTLRLEGCLKLVSSLFRALPDPQVDLAIRINQLSEFDHSSHWQPNMRGRHAQIHKRIARFWCTHGGDLPGGALDVDINWIFGDLFNLTMSFDSGPRVQNDRGVRLFYKCPAWKINAFDPILGHIHTLRLSHPQITWAIDEPCPGMDRIESDCLPNLRHVAFEECSAIDLSNLEDWLQRRMNSYPRRPLTSIIFKNCNDDVRPMAARINHIISTEWVVEKTENP